MTPRSKPSRSEPESHAVLCCAVLFAHKSVPKGVPGDTRKSCRPHIAIRSRFFCISKKIADRMLYESQPTLQLHVLALITRFCPAYTDVCHVTYDFVPFLFYRPTVLLLYWFPTVSQASFLIVPPQSGKLGSSRVLKRVHRSDPNC